MIIVCAIGIVLLAYLLWKLYKMFFKKGYKHVCHNCPHGCECNKSKVIRDGCHKNGPDD